MPPKKNIAFGGHFSSIFLCNSLSSQQRFWLPAVYQSQPAGSLPPKYGKTYKYNWGDFFMNNKPGPIKTMILLWTTAETFPGADKEAPVSEGSRNRKSSLLFLIIFTSCSL